MAQITTPYTIRKRDSLPLEIEERMRKDLIAYEQTHGIDVNYNKFSFFLTENNNETVSVLQGYTAFAEVYIDDMWVMNSHRRKGYGKRLIKELEMHFQGKGFNNINLVTSQFQAPEFYQKCGFKLEFVRHNIKNPLLNKFFFIKFFKDDIQTQGLLSPGL